MSPLSGETGFDSELFLWSFAYDAPDNRESAFRELVPAPFLRSPIRRRRIVLRG